LVPTTLKKVELRGGGILILSLDVDVFSIGGEDRALVFELIDTIRKYEQSSLVE